MGIAESEIDPSAGRSAYLHSDARWSTRNARRTITVKIASGRRRLCKVLQLPIASEQDLTIIGDSVTDPARLLSSLEERLPNLLLLDKRLLDGLSPKSTKSIRAKFPAVRVLLVCDRAGAGVVETIVINRFHGFLLTCHAGDTCVKAIRTVSEGQRWLPRALLEKAIFEMSPATDRGNSIDDGAASLTKREAQTVEYVCQGFANKQIAAKLGVQEDTVKKHLHNVYAKLGVNRRTELIVHRSASLSANA